MILDFLIHLPRPPEYLGLQGVPPPHLVWVVLGNKPSPSLTLDKCPTHGAPSPSPRDPHLLEEFLSLLQSTACRTSAATNQDGHCPGTYKPHGMLMLKRKSGAGCIPNSVTPPALPTAKAYGIIPSQQPWATALQILSRRITSESIAW